MLERWNNDADIPLNKIDVKDLKYMFNICDYYFLGNYIQRKLKEQSSTIKFKLNPRLKTSIAICRKHNKSSYTIEFNYSLIKRISTDNITRNRQIGGIPCLSILMGFILNMEHELTHMLIHVDDIKEACHGPEFKIRLRKIFGQIEVKHTSFKHELKDLLNREKLKIGMNVKYINKNERFSGVIIKLNPKRAKIRRQDGQVWNVNYDCIISINSTDITSNDNTHCSSLNSGTSTKTINSLSSDNVAKGQRVYWNHKGRGGEIDKHSGIIVRLNTKTVGIECDNGDYWRVSYNLIKLENLY